MKSVKALPYTDHVVAWTMRGIYLGYPPCCIGEFIVRMIDKNSGAREKRKFNGTGYVPCAKCNKKSTKNLLTYISKHRQHPEPFPNCDEIPF